MPLHPSTYFPSTSVWFCVGLLRVGGIVFDHDVFSSPWPSTFALISLSANLL